MARKTATAIAKNLTNLDELIGYCISYGADYNPDPLLGIDIPALQNAGAALGTALKNVKTTFEPWQRATNARELVFADLEGLSSRIINAMVGCRITQQTIDDAMTIHRKIVGLRSPGSPTLRQAPSAAGGLPQVRQGDKKTNENGPVLKDVDSSEDLEGDEQEEEINTISSSQQGFDDQVDHFEKMLELLAIEPRYLPGPSDLSPASLNAKLAGMKLANSEVVQRFIALDNARIVRNELVNDEINGVVTITKAVKGFVVSVYGINSAQDTQVSNLEFRKIRKAK